jgi:carbon starvation protein CstA
VIRYCILGIVAMWGICAYATTAGPERALTVLWIVVGGALLTLGLTSQPTCYRDPYEQRARVLGGLAFLTVLIVAVFAWYAVWLIAGEPEPRPAETLAASAVTLAVAFLCGAVVRTIAAGRIGVRP